MSFQNFTSLNSNDRDKFMLAINFTFQYFQEDLEVYLRKLGAGNQTKDIVQDVFLNLIKTYGNEVRFRMDNQEASLLSYLKTMVFRVFLRIENRKARSKAFNSFYVKYKPTFSSTLPFQREDHNRLRAKITNVLSAREKYLFYLIIDEGKRQIDIAKEDLQIPAVNVRVQWHRIKQTIKECPEINRC